MGEGSGERARTVATGVLPPGLGVCQCGGPLPWNTWGGGSPQGRGRSVHPK